MNVTNNKQSYNFNEAVTMSCNYGYTGETVTARCTDVKRNRGILLEKVSSKIIYQ